MEENRKIILFGGIAFLFLMGCINLAAIISNPWEELQNLATGSVLGLVGSIVLFWYIAHTCDPVALRLKDSQANSSMGCWLPIIAIGGLIAERLLSTYFASPILDVFVGCILSVATLTLFFLACLAWWYRPRKDF
jgi:arginine exporter protein ArgO